MWRYLNRDAANGALTEADCRRRVHEVLLAEANADDEAVASHHLQRAMECARSVRTLLRD